MGIAVLGLSIILQFFAAILALRIATTSRRVAWFPLALAILLMGIRRSFSLYNKLAFERAIDVGSEIIALTISALMVFGLISVRRWGARDESSADPGPSQLSLAGITVVPRIAILLGLSAIIASCATGYFAFRAKP